MQTQRPELWKQQRIAERKQPRKLSRSEYIAESFCAYMKGEEIEPNLKALFDEKRK